MFLNIIFNVWVTCRPYPDPFVRGKTNHIPTLGRGKEMRVQA